MSSTVPVPPPCPAPSSFFLPMALQDHKSNWRAQPARGERGSTRSEAAADAPRPDGLRTPACRPPGISSSLPRAPPGGRRLANGPCVTACRWFGPRSARPALLSRERTPEESGCSTGREEIKAGGGWRLAAGAIRRRLAGGDSLPLSWATGERGERGNMGLLKNAGTERASCLELGSERSPCLRASVVNSQFAIRIALLMTIGTGPGWQAWADDPPEVEAFEVGLDDLDQLPRGKEADGIAGDLVLRNSKVEALGGGNLPGRKANMAINWGPPTPG